MPAAVAAGGRADGARAAASAVVRRGRRDRPLGQFEVGGAPADRCGVLVQGDLHQGDPTVLGAQQGDPTVLGAQQGARLEEPTSVASATDEGAGSL